MNNSKSVLRDLSAGVVVFLVALPLCLGVAVASGAPPFAGLIAGIVGGIVVGLLSGSHTSVSGPAAGLTAVVAHQIGVLGDFQSFAMAVVLAGLMQIAMGACRAGFISSFFPTSVIKGLLAAIGIIIILKQIPHLLGRDFDPEGDESFLQPDKANTFSEIAFSIMDPHLGAMIIGLSCVAILILWDRAKVLKKSPVPAPLIVVLLGTGLAILFDSLGRPWTLVAAVNDAADQKFVQFVRVPRFESLGDFFATVKVPNLSLLANPDVWVAAITVAIVASLETLLNVEAVDKIDPQRRVTPTNRELLAQGAGNVASGLLAGLPVTSVIVRSSANINAGATSKLSSVFHGLLLALCVAFLPLWLNKIPLACLAAILVMTGWKLASWKIIRSVYKQGWPMFLPFVITLLAIVFTDLLKGTIIGLGVSMAFILQSNFRKPVRRILEKHAAGEVLHLVLPNQVSFLKRASLARTLEDVPPGGHVLVDASETDYIDPDILDLIRTFEQEEAPIRGVHVSLLGFHERYEFRDRILFADYTSREVRDALSPDRVLEILKEGHERFRNGEQLMRNLRKQMSATATGQTPLAAVLGCIDSRTPTEMIFDTGLGEIFTVRIAGNIAPDKVIGSLEYACAVAGAKLILVLGHTRCGAVAAAVDLAAKKISALQATGCEHLDSVVDEVQVAIADLNLVEYGTWTNERKAEFADQIAIGNVRHSMNVLREKSRKLRELESAGTIRIVGAIYDVRSGHIQFDL
jgi:carbonic anhydrase/SulP family sulfate permease